MWYFFTFLLCIYVLALTLLLCLMMPLYVCTLTGIHVLLPQLQIQGRDVREKAIEAYERKRDERQARRERRRRRGTRPVERESLELAPKELEEVVKDEVGGNSSAGNRIVEGIGVLVGLRGLALRCEIRVLL
jgi:hypothetical protein